MTNTPTPSPDSPGGSIRSYPYVWAPVLLVFGLVTVVAVPYLALVVLLGVLVAGLVVVGKLAWFGVSAMLGLGRSVQVPEWHHEREHTLVP
jgi:hypothetical protein